MNIQTERIEPAPASAGDGVIRAKLFNPRLGLKDILIEAVSGSAIDAIATGPVPTVGELVTVLLPTGSELSGIVSRVQGATFSVSCDPEATALAPE